jgi:hypothetical protein
MTFMGEVHGSSYSEKVVKCLCDARCLNAEGPDCNCECNGQNHGIGMLGLIIEDKAMGRVNVTPQKEESKHYRWAQEYNSICDEINRAIKEKKLKWSQITEYKRARDIAIHSLRMKRLWAILGKTYLAEGEIEI